jgi:AraC-like DNA-binding protein
MPERAEQALLDIHAAMGWRSWEEAFRNVGRLYELVPACASPHPGFASRTYEPASLVAQAEEVAAFSPGMGVQELARALGVSRTKLFTAFRDTVGRTPVAMLTEVRLAKARELLATTDLKLSAVAQMSGFAGEKYFLRRFRQVQGCTPSEYRARGSAGTART